MNQLNQHIIRQNTVRKLRDRYKPLFCSRDFYEKNQKHFAILATKIVADENIEPKMKPDQFEKFIVTTLILSLLRRPLNWFGGLRKTNNKLSPICTFEKKFFLSTILIKPLLDLLGIKWATGVNPHLSVYEFLNSVKIKSIPDKVFWSLNFLSANKDLFIISNKIPTPYELLNIQARGQRVITFEENFNLWHQLKYEHRDVLSFWLHDLVHAAEFFQNDELRKIQIHFYRWIEQLSSNSSREVWLTHFLCHEQHRTKFEYLISDMNSHPLHLIKTFRAILDEHNPNNWPQVISQTWQIVNKDHQNNSCIFSSLNALNKVNSPDFERCHYDALLHILSCINDIWLKSNKPIY